MAHKMGAGSTKNTRDSKGQRLGVKIFGNQYAKSGSIIVRQRGTKFKPGISVGCGKDHTLFALEEGKVHFRNNGFVDVIPEIAKKSTYFHNKFFFFFFFIITKSIVEF